MGTLTKHNKEDLRFWTVFLVAFVVLPFAVGYSLMAHFKSDFTEEAELAVLSQQLSVLEAKAARIEAQQRGCAPVAGRADPKRRED